MLCVLGNDYCDIVSSLMCIKQIITGACGVGFSIRVEEKGGGGVRTQKLRLHRYIQNVITREIL